MWIYNNCFFTAINVTQIRLSTMYFDSTGVATALLSDCSRGLRDNTGALAESQLSWPCCNILGTRSLAAGFGRHGMPPPASNDRYSRTGQTDHMTLRP